jgi:hypothetical protein
MAQQISHLGSVGHFLASHFPKRDSLPVVGRSNALRIALSFALVWAAPNSQQILNGFAPVLDSVSSGAPRWLRWNPNFAWGAMTAVLLWVGFMNLTQSTTFLYFQF